MPSVLELLQGRAIFLTGATGFVGKVLLEKLLRCIPGYTINISHHIYHLGLLIIDVYLGFAVYMS